jgi:hypothetical protein
MPGVEDDGRNPTDPSDPLTGTPAAARYNPVRGLLSTCLLLLGAVAAPGATAAAAGMRVPDLPVADAALLEQAHKALANVLTLQGVEARVEVGEDGFIDWEQRGPRDDKEWAWFLNRHLHFPVLLAAWRCTGERIFLEKIHADLRDWIVANPSPRRLNFTPAWRPLEVARRIERSWLPVYFHLPPDEPRAAAIRAMIRDSLPDHADMLRRFPSFWGGNHLLTEMTTLARIGAFWPDLPGAAEWRQHGVQAVGRLLRQQVYPDGVYKEISNHYHWIALQNFQATAEVLAAWPDLQEPPDFRARVAAMWEYFIISARPDGVGPLDNDADLEANWLLYAAAAPDFARADWDYIVSHGHTGSAPAGLPSRWFPWAGQLILRGGWGADDHWLRMDLGPRGTAHDHADHLHLDLALGQAPLLVDNGRYTYRPGAWRDYFAGPRGHNLLLIDGQAPLPPARATQQALTDRVQLDGHASFARGENLWPQPAWTGRGARRHERTLMYRHGDYALVLDRVWLWGPAAVAVFWHFHPDCTVRAESGRIVARHPSGRSLRLLLQGPDAVRIEVVRGAEDPPQGWHSPRYNERQPAAAAVCTAPASAPQDWLWLLLPDDHPEPLAIEQAPAGDRLLLRLHWEESIDTWSIPLAPGGAGGWSHRRDPHLHQ